MLSDQQVMHICMYGEVQTIIVMSILNSEAIDGNIYNYHPDGPDYLIAWLG